MLGHTGWAKCYCNDGEVMEASGVSQFGCAEPDLWPRVAWRMKAYSQLMKYHNRLREDNDSWGEYMLI